MFWIKAHLFILVISIQLIALLTENTLPYFPIEISRTAETGELNRILFPIGALTLGITLCLINQFKLKYFVSWLGLVVLSYFDDKRYHLLHMLGVLIMFIGFALIGMNSRTKNADLVVILCAVLIYLIRILIRVIVVALLEVETHQMFNIYVIGMKILEISYTGTVACRNPVHTLTIFRISGVLQWLTFVMIASILE